MYAHKYQVLMDTGEDMPEEVSTRIINILQDSEVYIKIGDILHFDDFLIMGFLAQDSRFSEGFKVTAISRTFSPKEKVVENILFFIAL